MTIIIIRHFIHIILCHIRVKLRHELGTELFHIYDPPSTNDMNSTSNLLWVVAVPFGKCQAWQLHPLSQA